LRTWAVLARGRYELTFTDRSGNLDSGYLEGELEAEYMDKDGYERINQVNLKIGFIAIEIKEGGDDQQQPTEEYREEHCRMQFSIAAGKVGGIAAKSGAAVPSTKAAVGYVGQDIGFLSRVAQTGKETLCPEAEVAPESEDWCR
jgi:hypothetical protein